MVRWSRQIQDDVQVVLCEGPLGIRELLQVAIEVHEDPSYASRPCIWDLGSAHLWRVSSGAADSNVVADIEVLGAYPRPPLAAFVVGGRFDEAILDILFRSSAFGERVRFFGSRADALTWIHQSLAPSR